MTGLGDSLVRFCNPPAVETLEGVFFRPLQGFTSAHQGLLWATHFRSKFPTVEEKSCLEEVIERFGDEVATARAAGIRISDRPESPRLWAKSVDGRRTIQIQRNAFVANWLRENEQSYVSYETRHKDFTARLRSLTQFLEQEGLGVLEPTSCMMTYVNHIDIESLGIEPRQAAEVFTFFRNETNFEWLPLPDQLAINLSYPMPDNRGRLHLEINPAVKSTNDKRRFVMQFALTARGRPEAKTIESALEWLDMGHEWIVRGFVDFTQKHWHSIWKREI